MSSRYSIHSILALPLLLVSLASTAQTLDKLVVAIDQAYAPFSLMTPSGRPEGVLVEMWRLWSKETGIEVEFAPGTWAQTLEMLEEGTADVHSGLSMSPARSEWLAFSEAIHSVDSAFYRRARADSRFSDSMQGARIGVIKSSYQLSYVEDAFPGAVITAYPDPDGLLSGLLAEEVDFVFDEVPAISRTVGRLGWHGLVARVIGGEITNTIHAAVSKDQVGRIEVINDGFRDLNPILLASIDERWFPNPQHRHYHASAPGSEIALSDEEVSFLSKNKVLTLASTPNWPPFEIEQADGAYAGIAADFIRTAAAKVGLSIEPVFDTAWDAHLGRLRNQELDVAPGLNETPDRLEHFTFTTPYIEYYSAIFTRDDRPDINSSEDLAGKSVALEDGYAIARNLPTDRPEINILLVQTTQEALEAVSSGKADAYIGNQVVAAYLIKKYTLPNLKLVSLWRTDLPGQLRFAVHRDRPILRDILQKGLDTIDKEEREAIFSTYIDVSGFQQNVFSLTQDQWEWLKLHPRLTLGVDPASAPLEFIDQDGNIQGISSEYVSFIADKLRVDMRVAHELSWSDVLRSMEQDEIDVITSITQTPAREENLLFTKPYIEFPIVIFSQNQAPLITGLSDLTGGRIAVVEGYAAHEFLIADHPELTPVLYPNVREAINALALEEVDWFINDLASGSYAIEKQGITTLKVAATSDYTMALAMAVSKTNPELVAILDRVLDVVSDEKAAELKGKWLALKFEHGLDMGTVLTWAAPIAGVAILIIVLVALWNRQLGSEIAEREKAQSALGETMLSLDKKNRVLEGLSAKLSKYLSPQVYDSIFSGSRDVTLSTERKKLTVFFSDIVNFTQTTDDMQPEDLTALLNSYFTEMSAIATEYGATIDKFVGDAMLLFFGDPETKGVKMDAELCVRMAVAMQKRMVTLEHEWQAMGYNKPFKIRVGINTGYCNVGNFGSEARMDYTIIGGEVNLAARLEGRADPGGVFISSETHALVKDMVVAEERESITVKGIHRKIRPFAVLSLRDDDAAATSAVERTIRVQEDGFSLAVDLDAVPAGKHGVLSSRLMDIARRLEDG